jgi:glucosamine--fructose-6-phosphate aminotransferase (isomerizing)
MQKQRLHHDILNQPQSLQRVVEYQLGEGRPALAEAAAAIGRAGRVVLTGMGSSLFACVPLQYLLISRGFACEVIDAAELVHYLSGSAKGAVVVLVSRSGESVEISRAIDRVGALAAATVGVTNEPEGRLARETRYPVLVNSCPDEMVAVQTYTGTLLTLLVLGYLVLEEPEPSWRGQVETAVESVSQTIARFEAKFDCPLDFPDGASSVYLLARGPSCASALEGALLFNEVAKAGSTAMGAGHFRHGPAEIVGADFRGIIFAPQGATRGLNIALARDLQSFGGRVRVVGPGCGDVEGFSWDTPGVPESVAPLVEIVPVQFAALRLAEQRGITPGSFRYVPQVTVSESGFKGPTKGVLTGS